MKFEIVTPTETGSLVWDAMTEWEFGTTIGDAMAEGMTEGQIVCATITPDDETIARGVVVFNPVDGSIREYLCGELDREVRYAVRSASDMMVEFYEEGA